MKKLKMFGLIAIVVISSISVFAETYDVTEVVDEGRRVETTSYNFKTWRTVKDRNDADVEILDDNYYKTREQLVADNVNLQAQIDENIAKIAAIDAL